MVRPLSFSVARRCWLLLAVSSVMCRQPGMRSAAAFLTRAPPRPCPVPSTEPTGPGPRVSSCVARWRAASRCFAALAPQRSGPSVARVA